MNKITFPLKQSMQGEAVAGLQDALQLCLDRGVIFDAHDVASRDVRSAQTRAHRAELRQRHRQTGEPLSGSAEKPKEAQVLNSAFQTSDVARSRRRRCAQSPSGASALGLSTTGIVDTARDFGVLATNRRGQTAARCVLKNGR